MNFSLDWNETWRCKKFENVGKTLLKCYVFLAAYVPVMEAAARSSQVNIKASIYRLLEGWLTFLWFYQLKISRTWKFKIFAKDAQKYLLGILSECDCHEQRENVFLVNNNRIHWTWFEWMILPNFPERLKSLNLFDSVAFSRKSNSHSL